MRQRVEVRVSRGRVTWGGENGSPRSESTELEYDSPEEMRSVMARVGATLSETRRRIRLRILIESPVLQRRTLDDLPPVSAGGLQELVARGSARFFRQNGHALVSNAAWVRSDATPRARAVAVATEQSLAEAILDGLAEAGIEPEDILAAGDPPHLSLLPMAERLRRHRLEWLRLGKLGAMVAGVWLVALGAIIVQARRAEERVERELTRLEQPRRALIRARQTMDSAVAMIEALDEAATRQGRVLMRLERIVGLLPDSTFISSIAVTAGGPLTVSGAARRPQEVLAALDSAVGLGPAVFESTPAPEVIAGGDWGRFVIRLGGGRR